MLLRLCLQHSTTFAPTYLLLYVNLRPQDAIDDRHQDAFHLFWNEGQLLRRFDIHGEVVLLRVSTCSNFSVNTLSNARIKDMRQA